LKESEISLMIKHLHTIALKKTQQMWINIRVADKSHCYWIFFQGQGLRENAPTNH